MSILTHQAPKRSALPDPGAEIPPLENGDRLSRANFCGGMKPCQTSRRPS